MSRVDLHMHTYVSGDGEFSPEEMIKIAKKQNMEIIAISDHDSVSAVDECIKLGEKEGIKVIPATEINAVMDCGVQLHVLGYGINHNDPKFIEREKKIYKLYIQNSDAVIQSAINVGFKLDPKKVYEKSNRGMITSEMVGTTILEDPRNDDDPRLIPYRKGNEKSDNPGFNFYKDYYSQGKPCYTPKDGVNLPLKECADLIHSTGGIMVLAHPNHNIQHNTELLDEIYSYGLQGIEAYSSYHKQEDIDFFIKQAERLNLITTVGSDFHGKTKPAIAMGSIECNEEKVKEGLRKYNLI